MTPAGDDPRLDQLVELMVQLASGDLSARLDISPARAAVDAVITGVNVLAEELEVVHQGLEERVAERTAALHRAHVDLHRLAMTDTLTGLANRTMFASRVGEAFSPPGGSEPPPAVLLLDLDDFKAVNDTLGHAAGDAVLIEVAHRLTAVVRDSDTVARLGGDEFAILMPGATEGQVRQVAQRCLDALRSPVHVQAGAVWTKASVGIRFGTLGHSSDMLLRDADTAMYAAKARGRGTVAAFTATMGADALARVQVAAELRTAIAEGQLDLHYQPVVALRTGAIIGAEALVRWQHPVRGMIPPSDFISAAEQSGLILELGEWVVGEAITQLGAWLRLPRTAASFALHVNLSPADMCRRGLTQDIRRLLEASNVPPRHLAVEITETGLMTGDADGLETLAEMRALGVGVQIDDFGTGYSSISYLRRLPVDTVKVDRTLIANIATDPQEYRFAEAILRLIDSVGLRAVVEGIETAEQHRQLLRLGCRFGQGYYFSRPVPAAQMTAMLVGRPMLGLQRNSGVSAPARTA